MSKKILIFGDYAKDVLLWPVKTETQKEDPNYKHYKFIYQYILPGGTEYLKIIIENSLHNIEGKSEIPSGVDCYDINKFQKNVGKEIPNSINILTEIPGDVIKNVKKDTKYFRIESILGFTDHNPHMEHPEKIVAITPEFEKIFKTYKEKLSQRNKSIIILNDYGCLIRNNDGFNQLLLEYGKNSIIILKIHKPLFSGRLWDFLSENNDLKKQLIVIINSNDLRNYGIYLSRGLSWEKVVCDFTDQFFDETNFFVNTLKSIDHLIIWFDIDGILYLNRVDQSNWVLTIFYDPEYTEGGNKESVPTSMPGLMSAFTGGFAAKLSKTNLYRSMNQNKYISKNNSVLVEAIKYGIFVSRIFHSGYLELSIPKNKETSFELLRCDYPFDLLQNSVYEDKFPCTKIHLGYSKYFQNLSNWSIINESGYHYIKREAFRIVKTGLSHIKKEIPYAQFGNYITFDRYEIENYHQIEKIFREFIDNKEPKICAIAAFGSPGSGKSFGINGLVSKLGDDKFERILINLAQLESSQDLSKDYQKIRNISLKGKIPIVFFDEFDCTLHKEQYGWLKSFLAPIQDGEFTDNIGTYPIGKAIFVFAGGTKKTIQEFISSSNRLKENSSTEHSNIFRDAKGPDFISRLTGFVNVRGPNKYDDNDSFWVIRRAILLRFFLEKYMPQIIDINKNAHIDNRIIKSLLYSSNYLHGSRSMEAIIRMSSVRKKSQFDRSDLPSLEQLNLHIDGSKMMKELQQVDTNGFDFFDNIAMNLLSQMQNFHKNQDGKYDDHYWYELGWDNLIDNSEKEPFLRDSEFLLEIVALLGYEYSYPNINPDNSDFSQTISRLKENSMTLLFVLEHDRWLVDRVSLGWIYSNKHIFGSKNHAALLPLDYMPKDDTIAIDYIKEYMTTIPIILANSNIQIRKKNIQNEISLEEKIKEYYCNRSSYISKRNKHVLIESEYHIRELAKKLHGCQTDLMKEYFGSAERGDCEESRLNYINCAEMIQKGKIETNTYDFERLPIEYQNFFYQWGKKICEDLSLLNISVIPYISKDNKIEGSSLKKFMNDVYSIKKERFVFSEKEIELVTKQIHKRWIKFLKENNWSEDGHSEYKKKKSKWLKPFSLLPGDIIDKLKLVVMSYPEILVNCDFLVYKLGGDLLVNYDSDSSLDKNNNTNETLLDTSEELEVKEVP